MSLKSAQPLAFYPSGGPRRTYANEGSGKPADRKLPEPPRRLDAAHCPPAILDAAPDGGRLGVWVLVEESSEANGIYCTYEYGGGIA